MMPGRVEQICRQCQNAVGFTISDDGFFYCDCCGAQADDIVDTGVDEEQFYYHYSASLNRARSTNVIVAEPISQVKLTPSQYQVGDMEYTVGDGVGPTVPSDFGSQQRTFSYEDYYSEIRLRYLAGLQVMIRLQCETLVEKFDVSPLIVGLVGPIWLRFLASTRILADDWADHAVHDSEAQTQGEAKEFQPSANHRREPVNIHGKRLVMIWYRSLNSRIPLSCSLAISFLACHVAREAILTSDILKWAFEGKLPYLTAFNEIEKHLGTKSEACPISASRMFRPVRIISLQKLESGAADIAKRIGLELPPVNFYAIASRYCKQLCLPTAQILPLACQICDWSMPPELYLSANEFRIPTRVYVMSILIVAVRILFDINGYGMWEMSLSNPNSLAQGERNEAPEPRGRYKSKACDYEGSSPSKSSEPFGTESEVQNSTLDVVELLQSLEAKYNKTDDAYAYSCDLPSYLQYCKDVIFSGLQPSYEDLEEEKLLTEFWEFYQSNKMTGTSDHRGVDSPEHSGMKNKRSRKATNTEQEKGENSNDGNTCRTSSKIGTSHSEDSNTNRSMEQDDRYTNHQSSAQSPPPPNESHKVRSIRQMKLEMEENKFSYIPPRTKVKRRDYLHYARKRKDVYIYAVHTDYYILLRSCAMVAQVETRVMHVAVLSFERRLKWLEKKIDDSLNLNKNLDDFCDFCVDESVQNGEATIDLGI